MSTTAQNTPLPYFGRAWNVSIQTQTAGKFAIDNSAGETLRVVFDINKFLLMAYWEMTVTIYNLSSPTQSTLYKDNPGIANLWRFNQPVILGDEVSVSAGYQLSDSGAFGQTSNLLYNGHVLQYIATQENVVDKRLTLRCITGLLDDALGFTSTSLSNGTSDLDALNQIASDSGIPIENMDSGAQTALTQSQYSRGRAVHGKPFDEIRSIARQNNLWAWVSPNGLNVRSFSDVTASTPPKYTYGPPRLPGSYTRYQTSNTSIRTTLIGTPEQTQYGVMFRVLMDSDPKIGDVVELAPGTIINAAPIQYGSLAPVPSQNGLYVVTGIRHYGDTRGMGNDWFTEITAVVFNFFPDFISSHSPVNG